MNDSRIKPLFLVRDIILKIRFFNGVKPVPPFPSRPEPTIGSL